MFYYCGDYWCPAPDIIRLTLETATDGHKYVSPKKVNLCYLFIVVHFTFCLLIRFLNK